MKIYLFCPETGVYQGEDFADTTPMCPGREELPPYATLIAPPPYQPGVVPVFNVTRNTWEIRSVSALKAEDRTERRRPPGRLSKGSVFG